MSRYVIAFIRGVRTVLYMLAAFAALLIIVGKVVRACGS